MAVALVGDKLILVGGVGRYRLKLSSVEMLDLNTGLWINAPDTPETFTDVPPTCVIHGLVALCVSDIYMFSPSLNSWIKVEHDFDSSEFCSVKCLAAYKNTLYIGLWKNCSLFGNFFGSLWRLVSERTEGILRGVWVGSFLGSPKFNCASDLTKTEI